MQPCEITATGSTVEAAVDMDVVKDVDVPVIGTEPAALRGGGQTVGQTGRGLNYRLLGRKRPWARSCIADRAPVGYVGSTLY